MNKNQDISISQFKTIIANLEQEIAVLKSENAALKRKVSPHHPDELFSLRQIISLMPGNVFWKDREGRFLGCNKNVAKIFKLDSPADIIGKRNADFIEIETALALDKADNEIMCSAKGKFIEEYGFDANDQPAIYFTQKTPFFNSAGEVVGLLGISIDITIRKKIEEDLKIAKEKAEASNLAKSQFIAVINHELRTPLTGIIGLINLLREGQLSEDEKTKAIDDLNNCAIHLLTLVNDVLDFSRVEAGKVNLNSHAVNLNSLIEEVSSIFTGLTKTKGLALKIQLDHSMPDVTTDNGIMRQILINIVNNAIKFTNKGYVLIQTRCVMQTGHEAKIEISIQDTGQGIPTDKISQIFEPFKQLEDTYKRQSSRSGTGLGLAIVKRLAKLLPLQINVSSEVDKGSTFTLSGEFQIAHSTDSSNVTKLHPPEIASTHSLDIERHSPLQQRKKVLLIEDDQIVQHIHKKMLVELGCDVDSASCGYDGLQILGQHDIVFVDIGLSDITGFEVISTIRTKTESRNPAIPVIALTGYTGEEEKIACLKSGANEVANKPISLTQLGDLLNRYTRLNNSQ